jgi:hypothetical protein
MKLKDLYYSLEPINGIGISDKGYRATGADHHFYIEIYDRLFSHMEEFPIKLFELGIANGASIHLWSSFFKNGTITGLYINYPSRKDILESMPNVQLAFGNGCKKETADAILNHFPLQDIFIDDGSHILEDQLFALENYSKLVKRDGYFIMEDIPGRNFAEFLSGCNLLARRHTLEIYDYRQRENSSRHDDDILVVLQFTE